MSSGTGSGRSERRVTASARARAARSAAPRAATRSWSRDMFLDSVVNLQDGTATLETEDAAAAERDFDRFAAWIAQHDSTYHLGAAVNAVRAAVLSEVQSYQADPKQFTGLPPFGGAQIANLASQARSSWPRAAAALAALRDAQGPAAPPAVQAIFSGLRCGRSADRWCWPVTATKTSRRTSGPCGCSGRSVGTSLPSTMTNTGRCGRTPGAPRSWWPTSTPGGSTRGCTGVPVP
jgi:hypothetical protein